MTFIVILIALLIERFFDWSHLRRWMWYTHFQRAVMQPFQSQSSYLILGLTIVPLLLMVFGLQHMLKHSLFGLTELLFQLGLFLYCLGPQNLWADTFACINALMHSDTEMAADKLQTSFGITDVLETQTLHRQLVNHIFIAANQRVFAIIFWFLVLGPVGAVLYRTITLSAANYPKQNAVPELITRSRTIQACLDWVPVRIFTCLFALGGHCVKVLACWSNKTLMSFKINEKLLTECGAAALGNDNIHQLTEEGSAAKHAIGLLDRSFILTLVLVAIFVLLV